MKTKKMPTLMNLPPFLRAHGLREGTQYLKELIKNSKKSS